jgi:hypothetical protein
MQQGEPEILDREIAARADARSYIIGFRVTTRHA